MRSVIYNIVYYVLIPIVLIWSIVYYCWDGYNSYRIKHYGQDAVAVVTRKWSGTLDYDIEFEGKYYRNTIRVKKKVFREVVVGERFYARILADKMKYHKNYGITPRYIRIILTPLPSCLQDVEKERIRIDSIYNADRRHKNKFLYPDYNYPVYNRSGNP